VRAAALTATGVTISTVRHKALIRPADSPLEQPATSGLVRSDPVTHSPARLGVIRPEI